MGSSGEIRLAPERHNRDIFMSQGREEFGIPYCRVALPCPARIDGKGRAGRLGHCLLLSKHSNGNLVRIMSSSPAIPQEPLNTNSS